jgi:trans-L-3-hydroxyproline dehydratase
MLEKREWVRAKQDHLRRSLMLEPRGHADMYGAVLTEPVTAGSHAGVLFMHNQGYSTMCGHGIIAVTTIALERGLLVPGGDGHSIVFDTPAGLVRAFVQRQADRVNRVSFQNVPSFVLHGGIAVSLGLRQFRVDVAFGGAFYAIVDSESVGLPLDAAHLPELRRAGVQIKSAIERLHSIVHPLVPDLEGIYGTIFTGPARGSGADLRNVTVFADAQVDRSPCGTGTAAVMAVIDAMGLLGDDRPFVHESLVGTTFTGRIGSRTQVGDYSAILPEIEGSAWITGEHTFLVDDGDPLREGFRL